MKCFEFRGVDLGRGGQPAIAIAENDQEIEARGDCLASPEFAQADVHRLLIERSMVADAPSEVDGLKKAVVSLAQFLHLREHRLVEHPTFLDEVAKGGTHEDAEHMIRWQHGWVRLDSVMSGPHAIETRQKTDFDVQVICEVFDDFPSACRDRR